MIVAYRASGGIRRVRVIPDASERLRDYSRQYRFAVTTSFNADRRGAIFLPDAAGKQLAPAPALATTAPPRPS